MIRILTINLCSHMGAGPQNAGLCLVMVMVKLGPEVNLVKSE